MQIMPPARGPCSLGSKVPKNLAPSSVQRKNEPSTPSSAITRSHSNGTRPVQSPEVIVTGTVPLPTPNSGGTNR